MKSVFIKDLLRVDDNTINIVGEISLEDSLRLVSAQGKTLVDSLFDVFEDEENAIVFAEQVLATSVFVQFVEDFIKKKGLSFASYCQIDFNVKRGDVNEQ